MQPHDETLALAQYRLSRANEVLASAKRELQAEDYRTANNRAYYAIFHAMRAVLALERVDYKKHSAVIAHFNQHYIHTDLFPNTASEVIKRASLIRNWSDYDDFYICSKAETVQLVADAQNFVESVSIYLANLPTSVD